MKILIITPVKHISGIVEKLNSIGDITFFDDPTVEELFPITVAELGFAYTNTNQYLKCQVTFTYRRWINLKLINTNGNPESNYIDLYKAG